MRQTVHCPAKMDFFSTFQLIVHCDIECLYGNLELLYSNTTRVVTYIFRIFRIIRYNDLTLLLFLLFKMLPCLTKIPAIVCNTSVFSHPLDVHKLIIAHNAQCSIIQKCNLGKPKIKSLWKFFFSSSE